MAVRGGGVSTYEYVETAIWSDSTFHDLSAQSKVVYFWSFTNPRCNLAGLYKVAPRMIEVETGLTPRAVQKALSGLADARLVYYQDPLIWVRARVKYLHTHNASVARSIRKALNNLDQHHTLVQGFLFTYQHLEWLAAELQDFTAPAANPMVGFRCVSPNRVRGRVTNGVV